MWSNLMYVLPIAEFLMKYETSKEIKMEGDLMEELSKLIDDYVSVPNFKFIKSSVKATINTTYPESTSIWKILDDILHRYHLIPIIGTESGGIVTLSLEEGAAWRL